MDAFGKNLKFYRKKCSMSQSDLAAALNSRQTTVSSWERGVSTPPLSSIKQMSEILNVSLNNLLYNPDIGNSMPSLDEEILAAFHAADESTKKQVCDLLNISFLDFQ